VHYQVCFAVQRWLQGAAEVGEEIIPSPTALDEWAHGQVESQVSVGQQ